MWAQPVWLDIEGETMKDLVFQMRMQMRVHIRTREELDSQPISAYADHCTFAEVRDALVDTGATTLALPARLIRQLGLAKVGEKRSRSSRGSYRRAVSGPRSPP